LKFGVDITRQKTTHLIITNSSKRIDENVSILIWVKGCYLYRFRCVFVFAFFRGQRKMDIQHQSNR
jgi:hypothetical protein